MFHFTALAERQPTGPGPYGYDTKITSRGKSHIPAATIAGRYPGKGLRSFFVYCIIIIIIIIISVYLSS